MKQFFFSSKWIWVTLDRQTIFTVKNSSEWNCAKKGEYICAREGSQTPSSSSISSWDRCKKGLLLWRLLQLLASSPLTFFFLFSTGQKSKEKERENWKCGNYWNVRKKKVLRWKPINVITGWCLLLNVSIYLLKTNLKILSIIVIIR